MKIAGIDGCKGGWIAVEADTSGKIVGSRYVESLREYLLGPDAPGIVTIDIPIGLTDSGPRECDVIVRKLIKPRGSSVFPAPIRPAATARTRVEASAISVAIQEKGVGAQSFGIYSKICEVDTLLTDHPELRSRVFEIHPELCFAAMAARAGVKPATTAAARLTGMQHPKRSGPGYMERFALIEAAFGAGTYDPIRARHPRSKIADDDVLDAMAAAWTALRIHSGTAVSIPENPLFDSAGLPMAMWF